MIKLKELQDKFNQYFSEERRLFYLSNIGIVGLISSLLISFNAWSAVRDYPLSPVLGNLSLSSELQSLLFILAIISFGFSLFESKFRKLTISLALVLLVVLVLLDVTRLQPWLLHYFGILFLFSSFVSKKISSSTLLDIGRIIVVGMYFWSGAQKVCVRFFTEIFPWFTKPLWTPFGEQGLQIAIFIGLFVPFIEVLFAIGLLTRRFRNISILGSLLMLVVVLSSVGPFGLNWNVSIWPWNIALFSMVVLLFFGTNFDLKSFLDRLKKNKLVWIFIFIFWVMPGGNFVGLTDHYLSWSLYSGKVPEAAIFGDQAFLKSLSSTAKDGELRFILWAQQDLSLVPYPENRVFEDIFRTICTNNKNQSLTLVINNYSLFSVYPEYRKNFYCNEQPSPA